MTPVSADPVGSRYRPDIDGLRAIAIVPVVLYHLGLGCPGGYVGVDVFFVISGYLITGIIHREIEQETFTFAGFYERRVRRLFPALFAMLAIVLVAGWFLLLPSDFRSALRYESATVLFSSNFVCFWTRSGYFRADLLSPLLHTWSLAVEEQFYLVFPVFLLACRRLDPRQTRWLIGIGPLLSFGTTVVVMQRMPSAAFYLSPLRAWELAVGCLLALDAVDPLARRWQRETVGACGLGLIAWPVLAYSPSTLFPGWSALPPVLGAAMLLHCGASGGSAASRLLRTPLLLYLGAISYSLYLWHWPLIAFAKYSIALAPLESRAWWLLGASLLAAMGSYHLIEQPFRQRRLLSSRRPLFAGAALAMALLLALGYAGMRAQGMPQRFDAQTVQLDRDRDPGIPFIECSKRANATIVSYCVIGDPVAGPPALLIWGDSHALAWAPGFDAALRQQHLSAYFVYRADCPPLFDLGNNFRPVCRNSNAILKNFVERQHGLKCVIIVALWNRYFYDRKDLLKEDSASIHGVQAVPDQLFGTLRYFNERRLMPIVFGPVPTWKENVPLAMALARSRGSNGIEPQSLAEHQANNAPVFYKAARKAADDGLALFVDVATWFCGTGTCRYQEAGVPLYRDEGHLSVAGSRSRAPQLASVISQAGLLTR